MAATRTSRGTTVRLRRSSVAVVAGTALAIMCGSLLGATAANADTSPTDATTGTTAPATLDSVRLEKSAMVVYPAAIGYEDTIEFSVRGLTAAERDVSITGTAVLTKGAQVVSTWPVADDAATRLSWNGRIGKEVVAGVYTLGVTAWSDDGTTRTSSMKVLVSSEHLVTRSVTVRTGDLANAVTDTLPVQVAIGLRYGPVSLRIHTVATVRGKADIVITVPGYGSHAVPLRTGTHVTGPIPVARGFLTARFSHDWKKKDATLSSMYTVFTYRELVS